MYKILKNNVILLDGKTSIPVDVSNCDYRAYLAWIDNGNIPEPIDPVTSLLLIEIDSNIIIGDGVDEITLTISGGEPSATVTVSTLTGTTPGTISIQLDANGNGSQAFSCDTSPRVIVFSVGDSIFKVRAL